jgi:DNA sulfur modification protein DndB
VTENQLVTLKSCPTLEEAQRLAGAEAANTGAFSIPVVVFRQGRRTVVTGALPMSWVKNRLETRSAKAAKKGGSMADTQSALNRPEYPEHSETIAKYLIDNHGKNYIIPPLSLNIQHRVNLYKPDYPSEFLPGYLVIPGAAKLSITDGQHRRSGIVLALEALEQMSEEEAAEFGSDAVAVMVTCETDADQVHQDFADCSKTKPLPPSLLAVYDRRNPANRLVIDLERECPLFKGRIDSTSKTLSKKSTNLFLANQLRQLVKELLAGSYGGYALGDAEFEKRAVELLPPAAEELYSDALAKFSEYINYLSEVMPVWARIAKLPTGTLQVSQIPGIRDEGWICLSATGLNIIGRVGHKLFSTGELQQEWREYARKLADIDWKRSAEIWQGNISQGTRLVTQQTPVKNAFKKVCAAIGLPGYAVAEETEEQSEPPTAEKRTEEKAIKTLMKTAGLSEEVARETIDELKARTALQQ